MMFSIYLTLLAVVGSSLAKGNTGGLTDISMNHHIVQDLIKNLPTLSKSFEGIEVVTVVRAQAEVESGFRYILTVQTRAKGTNGPATQECKITIWIKSWLERRTQIEEKCKPLMTPMAGAWSESNVTTIVREVANVGLEIINRRCNCLFRRTITNIKRVQKKVVAGMMYKITVEMVETVCRNIPRNQGASLEECPAGNGAVAQECDITMIHQPWAYPKIRFFMHTCH